MLSDSRRYRSGQPIGEYLGRCVSCAQMDFQSAMSAMVNLLRAPKEVQNSTIFRKQLKNQWSRDDPAFVVLLVYLIVAASAAYSVTFGVRSAWHFVRVGLGSVLFEFGLCGVVMCVAYRYIAHTYLRLHRPMNTEQDIEWLYAFDVHCNAFFCMYLLLWPIQFMMCPILLGDNFLCTLLSNTLYALAFSYYHYITFLGYSTLPFLQKTERFLFPIAGIVLGYFLALLLRINLTRLVLGLYFD